MLVKQAAVEHRDDVRPLVLHTRVMAGTGGGPEKTILNSPRFLEGLGFRSKCAYLHPPNDAGFRDLCNRAKTAGAPLISVPDRGPFDLRSLSRLIRVCRKENVAIWHAHDYKSNAIGLLAKRRCSLRLVTTVHGWVSRERRMMLYSCLDRRWLRCFDHVICVSKDLFEEALRYGVRPARCHLLENSIDTEQHRRRMSRQQAQSQLQYATDRPLVGAVGRLAPEKGFDLLIRAIALLVSKGTDLSLWIAGEGPQRQSLAALIHDLQLRDHVRLLGQLADTDSFYQAMDAFVLSSYREGLPNVLLEAMAHEVPVVATNVAGIPSLIQHEENGILVEPGSVEQLARGLSDLLGSGQRMHRFSKAGRCSVEERYSFAMRMQKIAAIYDDLLTDV